MVKSFSLFLMAWVLIASAFGYSSHENVPIKPEDVITHYADMAEAKYRDALVAAESLSEVIKSLLNHPTLEALEAAKSAWKKARAPYQQTEVYRFGNPIVDGWEGRVNAWPLDEGLIDYVDASYGAQSDHNPFYAANVIANPIIQIGGKTLDATHITPDFLANVLHEAGGIEASVATGYHAIEFLLWGQDLNGTKAGHGNRPHTDYSLENCSNGHCDRRRQYLSAVSELLLRDLTQMWSYWKTGGAARNHLQSQSVQAALAAMLSGMGSLSYGELAGERMKLGLLLGDPEEEHDCFSDHTHYSHYYDALGIQDTYFGTYVRIDGTHLKGPSLADLLVAQDQEIYLDLKYDLESTMLAMRKLVERAETVEAYDQMIASNNAQGNAVVQFAIDALIRQTKSIERAMAALGLSGVKLEGSESLNESDAVFQ